jgi:hypothetical protein
VLLTPILELQTPYLHQYRSDLLLSLITSFLLEQTLQKEKYSGIHIINIDMKVTGMIENAQKQVFHPDVTEYDISLLEIHSSVWVPYHLPECW